MRQQFLQVLGSPEPHDEMTDVVRRFWTRAKPLSRRPGPPLGGLDASSADNAPKLATPTSPTSPEPTPRAQVIDLATWMRTRAVSTR
jgi:hypothetical protein